MHQSFVRIYILVLVIFAVEKSDCKQGGYQAQLPNIEDINFYYGENVKCENKDANVYTSSSPMKFIQLTIRKPACLSYGHSCWGAHGKRNGDLSNYPNTELLQQIMQKPTNKDSSIDQNQSQQWDIPTYFKLLKIYKKRSLKKPTNDNSVSNWNTDPEYFTPNGRYSEDQELDPSMVYKLLVNSEMYKTLYERKTKQLI